MSLRTKILQHSLHLLPVHSFSRRTLSLALSSLPSSHPDFQPSPTPESVIDTLFGEGISAPGDALVYAWEEAGRGRMEEGDPSTGVKGLLEERLRYSAEVGEHLVEAYALLSSPSVLSSLSMPTIPTALIRSFPTFRIPPLYSPPSSLTSSSSPPFPTDSHSEPDPPPSSFLSSLPNTLPMLALNPLGPFTYAWRIADTAILLADKQRGLRKGIWNEPLGGGPEWYTERLGVGLAYLAAESRLLQAHPAREPDGELVEKLHLPSALETLEVHLGRHESVSKAVEGGEKGLGGAMGYLHFVGKSLAGMIRSRGW